MYINGEQNHHHPIYQGSVSAQHTTVLLLFLPIRSSIEFWTAAAWCINVYTIKGRLRRNVLPFSFQRTTTTATSSSWAKEVYWRAKNTPSQAEWVVERALQVKEQRPLWDHRTFKFRAKNFYVSWCAIRQTLGRVSIIVSGRPRGHYKFIRPRRKRSAVFVVTVNDGEGGIAPEKKCHERYGVCLAVTESVCNLVVLQMRHHSEWPQNRVTYCRVNAPT